MPARAQVLASRSLPNPARWEVETRYSTTGALGVRLKWGAAHWAALDGITAEAGEWEWFVAAGPRYAGATAEVAALVGPVLKSRSREAGLWVPSYAHWGGVSVSGTLEVLAPLTREDGFALELSHLRALLALNRSLRLGVMLQISETASHRLQSALGPTMRLHLRSDFDLILDAGFGLAGTSSERILTLQWRH